MALLSDAVAWVSRYSCAASRLAKSSHFTGACSSLGSLGLASSAPPCFSCLSTGELAWPQPYTTANAVSTNRTRPPCYLPDCYSAHMVHGSTRIPREALLGRSAPAPTDPHPRGRGPI